MWGAIIEHHLESPALSEVLAQQPSVQRCSLGQRRKTLYSLYNIDSSVGAKLKLQPIHFAPASCFGVIFLLPLNILLALHLEHLSSRRTTEPLLPNLTAWRFTFDVLVWTVEHGILTLIIWRFTSLWHKTNAPNAGFSVVVCHRRSAANTSNQMEKWCTK